MNLVIANTKVRQDAIGRYLLNDLHRAAGMEPRHRPSRWLENQQTKGLIEELSIAGIPAIESKPKTGSFVCKELVYAYATWISPAFFLKVIRAYDAMVTLPPQVRPGQVESLQAERDLGETLNQIEVLGEQVRTFDRALQDCADTIADLNAEIIELQRFKITVLESGWKPKRKLAPRGRYVTKGGAQ